MFYILKALFSSRGSTRVLLIAHSLDNAGAERALHEMAMSLQKIGVNVALICARDGDMKSCFRGKGIPVRITKRLPWSVKYGFRPHLVVCNTIETARYILRLKTELPHGRVIWWIHESGYFARYILGSAREEMYLRALRSADHVYCVSAFSKSFIDPYNDDVRILPLGCSDVTTGIKTRRFSSGSDFVFLSIGPCDYVKGHDILIGAFVKMKSEIRSRCRLRIIGPIEGFADTKRIKELAEGCPQVELLGVLPHREALREIAAADVFVLASRGDSFPVSVIEALQFGKPVVLSRTTGLTPFLEGQPGCFIFDPADSDFLTHHMEDRFACRATDSFDTRGLFENNFSASSFEKNLRDLLHEVLDI